jgi:hypothetical protein
MGTFRFPSHAHVTLRRDGTAVIEAGTQDIGTGTLLGIEVDDAIAIAEQIDV